MRIAPGLLGVTITLGAGGCSLVDPYVDGDSSAYREAPSVETALHYAYDTRDTFFGAISDQALLRSGTGLLLIPIAALGAFYGVTSASDDVVLALGIGGAATYIGSSYLSQPSRQIVYALGADAITCSLATLAPLIALDEEQDSLKAALDELAVELLKLDRMLQQLPSGTSDPLLAAAEQSSRLGRHYLGQGRAILLELRILDQTIFNAIYHIRALMVPALQATEPNVAGLVAALGLGIPDLSGAIVPGSAGAFAGAATGASLDLDRPDDLRRQVSLVDEKTAAVMHYVETYRAHAEAKTLDDCAAEFQLEGHDLRLSPNSDIVINLGAGGQALVLGVRGGASPYAARWHGASPGTTPEVVHLGGESGEVRLSFAGDAPPGLYVLEVSDSNGTTDYATIQLVGKGSGGGSGGFPPRNTGNTGNTGVGPVRVADEGLRLCQEYINQRELPGVPRLDEDGRMGTATRQAIGVLLAGLQEDLVDAGVDVSNLGSLGDADAEAYCLAAKAGDLSSLVPTPQEPAPEPVPPDPGTTLPTEPDGSGSSG